MINERYKIHVGDCMEIMRTMPSDSVDCVVTSPPYWGLRDYGVDGQLGMERSLGEHISAMVAVFEEVRRILKQTGTLWLNYGDCYATTPNGRSAKDVKALKTDDRTLGAIYQPDHMLHSRGKWSDNKGNKGGTDLRGRIVAGGYMKPKDLCMVPNRIAIALQEAGWWVRSEIIWAKPNPMPESVTDRPATSHEKIWLLTKSAKYFYDNKAVKQPVSNNTHARISQDLEKQVRSYRANGGKKSNGPMKAVIAGSTRKLAPENQNMVGAKLSRETALALKVDKRNLRNYEPAPVEVWRMATKGFKDAHFATFPPELAERCILAGCPANGTVFDPFGGAGTTVLVALRHNRKAIMIELNPKYAEISRRRIEAEWKVKPKQIDDFGPLFQNDHEPVQKMHKLESPL